VTSKIEKIPLDQYLIPIIGFKIKFLEKPGIGSLKGLYRCCLEKLEI